MKLVAVIFKKPIPKLCSKIAAIFVKKCIPQIKCPVSSRWHMRWLLADDHIRCIILQAFQAISIRDQAWGKPNRWSGVL